jgi:hypothetical protein
MSNFLAIATVTATLSQTLQAAIGTDVPGATVSTVRPDTSGSGLPATGVNLYLYQVTPNAAWRNADLPTRRPNGELIQRPRVAIYVHYLLTFYGNEVQMEPQRLLGSVVRTLHARPMLTRQMIRDTVVNPTFAFLAPSDLADAIELVKFTPLPLSLEELSKLWSVFFQTPYTLSVTYQGTLVCIDSVETPRPALPVQARNLYVVPFRQPVIEQVVSQAGADQPILLSSTLVIQGRQLQGEVTQVRLAGMEVAAQDVSDTHISLPLTAFPPGSLRAGVQGVQVTQPMLMGTPPTPHRGVESNVAAIVLRPTITGVNVANVQGGGTEPRSADIAVQVAPTIGRSQRVLVLLNEVAGATPAAYSFVAPSPAVDTNSSTIPISGVRAAEYFVRMQVDGAESVLTVDTDPNSPTFNQFIAPRVTIP